MNWAGLERISTLLRVGVALTVASLATSGWAQERTAQLIEVKGRVVVVRKATGVHDQPQQIGDKVRNGAVFGGDVVMTEARSSAVLLFGDCSTIEIRAGSALMVRHVDLSATRQPATEGPLAARRVELIAGNIVADIVPNPALETVFKMSLVRVKTDGGTIAMSSERTGWMVAEVLAGSAELSGAIAGLELALPTGCELRALRTNDGSVKLIAPKGNRSGIELIIPSRGSFSLAARTEILVTSRAYAARLQVVRGLLTAADGRGLPAGDSLGFANADFRVPEGTPVAATTGRGTVDFLNDEYGIRVALEEGYGIVASENAGGDLQILAAGTNPGSLGMVVGGRTVLVQPGGELTLSPLCDQVDLRVIGLPEPAGGQAAADATGGLAVVLAGPCLEKIIAADAGGSYGGCEQYVFRDDRPRVDEEPTDEEEEGDDLPVYCGECGLPDGSGGCRYVDSLCNTDPCIADRRCVAGRCAGGRRLTSNEDPNCAPGGG